MGSRLAQVDVHSGKVKWIEMPGDVISDVCVVSTCKLIVAGTVYGDVLAFDSDDHHEVWSICDIGPVYSSPEHVSPALIMFYSQLSLALCCVTAAAGSIVWKAELGGSVFAKLLCSARRISTLRTVLSCGLHVRIPP
jgi:hypothetical protein